MSALNLMGLKYFVNGLQVKRAREVHDGKKFFVKVTNLIGLFMHAISTKFVQILKIPFMKEWIADAQFEPDDIEELEVAF